MMHKYFVNRKSKQAMFVNNLQALSNWLLIISPFVYLCNDEFKKHGYYNATNYCVSTDLRIS